MKKLFIKVAIFLMILQGVHTVGHHDHVHYERPARETLKEPIFNTSGTTNSVYSSHRGGKEV